MLNIKYQTFPYNYLGSLGSSEYYKSTDKTRTDTRKVMSTKKKEAFKDFITLITHDEAESN